MRLVALDFETYFDSADYTLSKMGPIEYIRDPRFEPLCCGVYISDIHEAHHYPPVVLEPSAIGEYLYSYARLEDGDTFLVGHNMAGFDALVLSEYYGIHPAHILDTIVMARWCGISRVISEAHGALTPFLGNGEKEAGTVVSDKKHRADFTEEEWRFFSDYCAADTLQCYKNCKDMLPYMTVDAITFGDLTAKMATQPMIRLDVAMLDEYIKTLDARAEEAMKELQLDFGFATKDDFLKAIRSAPKFTQMLEFYGATPPIKLSEQKTKTNRERIWKAAEDAQARGIDNTALLAAYNNPEIYEVYAPSLSKMDLDFVAMTEHPDERVAALVRARLEFNSSIERSRAVRLRDLGMSGKPMPVMLKTFYAHTSRYGAGNSEGATDGLNVQNLSKRDPNKLLIRQAMKAPVGYKFVSVDSSQIEARMLAYLANQTDLVEYFREGRDPYAELASKIFSIPANEIHDGAKSGDKKLKSYRNVGKTAILSAGYGVGAQKFSDTLLRQGVRLDDDLKQHFEKAKHAHNVYRGSNRYITAFWDRCQKVIEALCKGSEGSFGGPKGNAFHYGLSTLPKHEEQIPTVELCGTGYKLWYNHLRCERGDTSAVEYFYDRQKGKNAVATKIYGGALTENITQALAFQLLMWQACRMNDAGIRLIANIHDAWLACVPESKAEATQKAMELIMSAVPPWLEGFPVACEGEIGDTYEIA